MFLSHYTHAATGLNKLQINKNTELLEQLFIHFLVVFDSVMQQTVFILLASA